MTHRREPGPIEVPEETWERIEAALRWAINNKVLWDECAKDPTGELGFEAAHHVVSYVKDLVAQAAEDA